jgi:imidazolonepropionase-like amidohydrolase
MTPAQALTAASRTSAEVLRLDRHGVIAPGKSADFIVLDADPLENILNTRRISAVFLRGIEIDRARLSREWTRR